MQRVKSSTLFAMLLLLIFLGALYVSISKGWLLSSRLFPQLCAIAGSIFTLWIVLTEGRSKKAELKKKSFLKMKKPAVAKVEMTPRNEIVMIGWLLFFLGIILIFGLWMAALIFIPLFMRKFGQENWKTIFLYTAGTWFAVYLVFTLAMKVSLYGGVLGIAW